MSRTRRRLNRDRVHCCPPPRCPCLQASETQEVVGPRQQTSRQPLSPKARGNRTDRVVQTGDDAQMMDAEIRIGAGHPHDLLLGPRRDSGVRSSQPGQLPTLTCFRLLLFFPQQNAYAVTASKPMFTQTRVDNPLRIQAFI